MNSLFAYEKQKIVIKSISLSLDINGYQRILYNLLSGIDFNMNDIHTVRFYSIDVNSKICLIDCTHSR